MEKEGHTLNAWIKDSKESNGEMRSEIKLDDNYGG